MGSITSWSRLEPQGNDPSLGSLAARIADPLWMLARQWQFGEWQGEDAGSPVEVRVRYESTPVTRYRPGPATSGPAGSRPPGQPWEALVEAEPVGVIDRRLAARAGSRFLTALGPTLATRYGPTLRQRYGIAALSPAEDALADDRSQRVVNVLAARALDGPALRGVLAPAVATGTLPPELGIDPLDAPTVLAAAAQWLSWWDSQFPATTANAWQPGQLGYEFALAAPTASGEVVLAAPAHDGGRIDWTAFDVVAGASLGAAGDAAVTTTEFRALPTGVGFPGRPASRWWQFEDGNVDFGGLDTAPDDLGRLLLAEFALVYGNDFFSLPLPLPVGTLCRIDDVEVLNTFGETVTIPTTASVDGPAAPRWRLFQLGSNTSDPDGGAGWLVVPANAVDILAGEAIEDVLFSRDELADLGWAVERRVTGPAGSVLSRSEVHQRAQPMPPPPSGQPVPRYELASDIPPYWLPLVPVQTAPGQVELQLRGLQPPQGRLLGSGFALDAAQLPRSGRQATRHHRRSRWTDGSTVSWTSPRVRPGRGESSAGLRFDDLRTD